MIFVNYKKSNQYKDAIDKFSDENRNMSFGVVKSFITGRYKWLATYLFKNRNNTQTNKHRAFIGFYSDVEMDVNEYGSVAALQVTEYFNGRTRPKFPRFFYELSSKQYKAIGQEYVDFDAIRYVDESGKIEIDFEDIGLVNHHDIYHTFGDCPAFVMAGYKIPLVAGDYVYCIENQPDAVDIKLNNVEIIMNDDGEDLMNNDYVKLYLASATCLLEQYNNELVANKNIMSGQGFCTQKLYNILPELTSVTGFLRP